MTCNLFRWLNLFSLVLVSRVFFLLVKGDCLLVSRRRLVLTVWLSSFFFWWWALGPCGRAVLHMSRPAG